MNLSAACLTVLAAWVLLSGLDDLFIEWVSALPWQRKPGIPSQTDLDGAPERRIAIFIALWHEHQVTGQMLERSVSTIRYRNYDIFVGVYPNDRLTARAVADAAARHPRIHAVMLPHDGPTSKGDNLNWIHRHMQAYERERQVRFEVVVTHDAEDVIHPESLRLINWYSADFAMVQIPVLALATPAREFTHGLYCDEFAQFQQMDIPVRQILGGFLPSNGVGCGFDRRALDRLAESRAGLIFDPNSLTEDYDNGFRLYELGYRQIFVPLRFDAGDPIATREYFPRNRRAAVRQRSRWVAGIALQGWQRQGWRGSWLQRYWFWRDRKGLVGSLVAPAANFVFVFGAFHWQTPANRMPGIEWLYGATLLLTASQISTRMRCSARVYGWRFASLTPLRMFWGNLLNFHATLRAVSQFAVAHLRQRTLRWQKTEHSYPLHSVSAPGRPRLGELLVRMQCVEMDDVQAAMQTLPRHSRLGEYLVRLRKLSEENLYRALSSQAGIPLGAPEEREVSRSATRALPVRLTRRWKVLPYRVDMGQLHLATTEIPSEEMAREIARASSLDLRFRLVAPKDFRKLVEIARRQSVRHAPAGPASSIEQAQPRAEA